MYDKILVPLDGSELAEVSLYYAQGLAGSLHSSITLVYVKDPNDMTSPYMYECYLRNMVQRVKAAAEERAAETGGGEIKVDCKVLEGDPAEEIIDYADKSKVDLIVLSTQGKSGVRRWAMGNVADKVINATRRQVFLVRATGAKSDVHKKRLKRILVPVDGNKGSESILKFVVHLATKLNLEVTLLHVWVTTTADFYSGLTALEESLKATKRIRKSKKGYVEKLADRLRKDGVKVKAVFIETSLGDEATEIINLAKEGDFSLVAMATHGRSGVSRWIFGSNANKVLYGGSTPLLLVRPVSRKK